MDTLRIGVIGCGAAGGGHASSLVSMGGVTVVGLADPSDANTSKLKSRVRSLAEVPAFGTPEELYNSVEVDGVAIVTPHTLHYPQIMDAVGRGLHVICEKPLACDPEHAREIEAAASAAGVTVMVSYQLRLDPAYGYMRRVMRDGGLGQLRAISINCGQSWYRGTKGSWRQDPKQSGGGMLMDSGSHVVDIMLWLVDQPVAWVAALVDNLDSPVDINTAATVGFADGMQGSLTVVGDLPAAPIEKVLVTGTKGVLYYETEPQHPWRTGKVSHYKDGGIVQPLNLDGGTSPDRAWVDTIRGERENPSPPSAGVLVAGLTSAIYRSAAEGRTVKLLPA